MFFQQATFPSAGWTPPPRVQAESPDWGKEAEHLKLADTVPMRTSLALLRNLIHDALQVCLCIL